MSFLSRLTEALAKWERTDAPNRYAPDVAPLAEAARLLVEGEPLWICLEHHAQDAWQADGYGEVAGYCMVVVAANGNGYAERSECRMVERRMIQLP